MQGEITDNFSTAKASFYRQKIGKNEKNTTIYKKRARNEKAAFEENKSKSIKYSFSECTCRTSSIGEQFALENHFILQYEENSKNLIVIS